jgi:enhancing lycopene biosynthesis protein 2
LGQQARPFFSLSLLRSSPDQLIRARSIVYSTEHSTKRKRIAVVLSGCGFQDGSEIHEGTSILIHLSRNDAEAVCFAPNVSVPVYDHAKDEESSKETRNALVESARISRGQIRDLEELNVEEFDAVVFPGGYGVAKTLSTFAKEGTNCSVRGDVEDAVKDFSEHKKPIGMCCIAPVLAAKLLPGVEVTIGNNKDVATAISTWGSKNVEKAVNDIHVDENRKVVTTPAYMYDAHPHEVFEGIGKMIDKVIAMC